MKALLAFIICLLIIILMQLAGKADCGIPPIKPIPPPECKDLVAECLCDSEGNNCSWIWKCQQ